MGQCHRYKVRAEWRCGGETLCKFEGLKVLAITVEEIARVNKIADGRKTGCLCRTMPAGVTKMDTLTS